MGPTKLALVDDHTVAREALVRALQQEPDLEIVGSWPDAEGALARLETVALDLVILDYRLPGLDGIEAARRFLKVRPELGIVMLSGFGLEDTVLEAFEAGVRAFLPKEVSLSELLEALRAVQAGQTVLSPRITRQFLEYCAQRPPRADAPVSEAQLEVLRLAACGLANKEIADRLGVTVNTVKLRLKEVFLKLEARDRTHAVITALKLGLFGLRDCP